MATTSTSPTLDDPKKDTYLWYKIKVMIYDARNVEKNPDSNARLNSTLDPLHISFPYFTEEEARRIKSTLVTVSSAPTNGEEDHGEGDAKGDARNEQRENLAEDRTMTIQQALETRNSGFLDKRKASGDFRQCGPHDLAPLFESVFGIDKRELEDEKFLGRLRRSGLSDWEGKLEGGGCGKDKKAKKDR
ncbi:hypothetical protein BDZ45DRAFT_50885 [Acephala macrosclerotiorum]|nr:hypothetical protein BDZ45DRAFT_50885 [Acephala macrosclerotiorum]